MPKYSFAFASGALVIVLALAPFIAPPEQITWLRWRIGGIACGTLALVALGVQLYLQLLPELQGVKAHISQDDIEPKRDQLAGGMRRTADKLAMAAVKLTYPRTKIEGSFLVLDEDDNGNGTEKA